MFLNPAWIHPSRGIRMIPLFGIWTLLISAFNHQKNAETTLEKHDGLLNADSNPND